MPETNKIDQSEFIKTRSSLVTITADIIKSRGFRILVIDFLLLLLSFFAVNYIRKDSLSLSLVYTKLLVLLCGSWFIMSVLFGKFRFSKYHNLQSAFITISLSDLFVTYLASMIIVINGLYAFSRGQLFGTIVLFYALELVVLILFYVTGGKKYIRKDEIPHSERIRFRDFSFILLFYDFAFFTISFFMMNYIKGYDFELRAEYEDIFLFMAGVWLISSVITNKFNRYKHNNFYYIITPYIKSAVIMTLTMSVVVFSFRLFYYSRLHVYGTFILLFVFEMIFSYIRFITKKFKPSDDDIESAEEVRKILKQDLLPEDNRSDRVSEEENLVSVRESLKALLEKNVKIFEIIDNNIKLDEIEKSTSAILDTLNIFNIEIIKDSSLNFFLNMRKVNDLKRLNQYFLKVHNKLRRGGWFVGCAITNETFKDRLYNSTSKYNAHIIYTLHFIFQRVLPKLPYLDRMYTALTQGRNRALSKAEVLGRLHFCGFDVICDAQIDDRIYYISRRLKYPSIIKNPSYGPTVRLPRIGMNREVMYIRKLRTMHPYSEFLQEYIYKTNKLDKSGKLAGDYRLTAWGKMLRSLWLDELPQLVNYVQGDLALVGVRALSEQYFSLYPRELQELRVKFKPGLIPPYYADMPENFDEIVESEKNYLHRKEEAPLKTDVVYFFRAVYNIVLRSARSR